MICLWVGCITQVYIETTNILVMDSDSKDYLFEESHGSFHLGYPQMLIENSVDCSPEIVKNVALCEFSLSRFLCFKS